MGNILLLEKKYLFIIFIAIFLMLNISCNDEEEEKDLVSCPFIASSTIVIYLFDKNTSLPINDASIEISFSSGNFILEDYGEGKYASFSSHPGQNYIQIRKKGYMEYSIEAFFEEGEDECGNYYTIGQQFEIYLEPCSDPGIEGCIL